MQEIQIIGRIGKDAEVKDFNNNQVVNFSVAVSEKFTNKQTGEITINTLWFECAKWGNNASVAQYIKKGGQIFVKGKINNRAWLDKDGKPQVTNGINVFEIELLGNKEDLTTTSQPQQSQQPRNSFVDTPKNNPQEVPNNISSNNESDDLPF
jgi:single-strand DNA-binding protein